LLKRKNKATNGYSDMIASKHKLVTRGFLLQAHVSYT